MFIDIDGCIMDASVAQVAVTAVAFRYLKIVINNYGHL